MSSASRPTKVLRLVAGFLLLAAVLTWVATGAHWGWTRTSVTEMERDEVTGIDFPVEREKFVAGVEVLGAGIGAATALALVSLLVARRSNP